MIEFVGGSPYLSLSWRRDRDYARDYGQTTVTVAGYWRRVPADRATVTEQVIHWQEPGARDYWQTPSQRP
jgi:hypothetical protein